MAPGSTGALMKRRRESRDEFFSAFACINFTNIALQILSFCFGKETVDLNILSLFL